MNDNTTTFLENKYWLNFELTNICNIPCYYCSNKFLKNKGSMTLEIFKNVLNSLTQFDLLSKEIIFCGYGEPFLNKHIYDMMDYVADLGLPLTIQTNGKWQLPVDRKKSLYKVKRLSITIDGVTNKVYNLSRPNTNVDLIFENLKNIIELRKNDHQKSPILTAKMNVFRFNAHEIHDFVRKCVDLGIDQINLSKGIGPNNVMIQISDENEFKQYSGIDLNIDPELLKNIKEPQKESGKKNIKNKLKLSRLIKKSPENLFLELNCFDTSTIKWDGNLSPCCWDFNSRIPLGKLDENKLEKILSNDNLQKIGSDILKSRRFIYSDFPCHSCVRFIDVFDKSLSYRIKKLVPENIKKILRKNI
jgi:MoaA/NifB/PqqE/SkfB family radical SAM enzyme